MDLIGGIGQGLGLCDGYGQGDGGAAGHGAGGPEAACGLDAIRALAPGAHGTGMVLDIGGELYDLGPGLADTDADGRADSVTLADERGLSIYSDIDGDGAVDHVTTVLFDGTWETWTSGGGTSGGAGGGVGGEAAVGGDWAGGGGAGGAEGDAAVGAGGGTAGDGNGAAARGGEGDGVGGPASRGHAESGKVPDGGIGQGVNAGPGGPPNSPVNWDAGAWERREHGQWA